MFARTDVSDKKRDRDVQDISSDDEPLYTPKAIIPGLNYMAYFTMESEICALNNSIVEIIMIFNSKKAADDLSRQLVLLCQARSECIIYADQIKVTKIAEFENHGTFRRIYLAPYSDAAKISKYKPNQRSHFIMQQLHSLYDLSRVGKITCNISKLQVTKRIEVSDENANTRTTNSTYSL